MEQLPTTEDMVRAFGELQQQLTSVQAQQRQQEQQVEARRNVIPRVPKPETFNGRSNVHSWIWSVEQYFATTGVLDETSKTQFAVNLFRGNVTTWMRTYCSGTSLAPWPQVRSELERLFAPISEEQNARDRLASLRQNAGVARYAAEFRQLILLLPQIPESDQIDRFARGLKLAASREVYLRAPATLDEAIRIAERYDTITWKLRSKSNVPFSSTNRPPPRQNDAMDLSAVQFKRLTPIERKKIMDNNGCLFCRKLHVTHRARNCPAKRVTRFNQSSN